MTEEHELMHINSLQPMTETFYEKFSNRIGFLVHTRRTTPIYLVNGETIDLLKKSKPRFNFLFEGNDMYFSVSPEDFGNLEFLWTMLGGGKINDFNIFDKIAVYSLPQVNDPFFRWPVAIDTNLPAIFISPERAAEVASHIGVLVSDVDLYETIDTICCLNIFNKLAHAFVNTKKSRKKAWQIFVEESLTTCLARSMFFTDAEKTICNEVISYLPMEYRGSFVFGNDTETLRHICQCWKKGSICNDDEGINIELKVTRRYGPGLYEKMKAKPSLFWMVCALLLAQEVAGLV